MTKIFCSIALEFDCFEAHFLSINRSKIECLSTIIPKRLLSIFSALVNSLKLQIDLFCFIFFSKEKIKAKACNVENIILDYNKTASKRNSVL